MSLRLALLRHAAAVSVCPLLGAGRSEKSGDGEPAPHIIVGPPASERFDVPQFAACSHPAAGQPGRTGERIRAAHAAGGIGRRGQFGDQRRAIRSRQSQRAQRPQRHRQRVEDPAGPVGTNAPPPPLVYGPIASSPSRVVAPYAGASQRIISADQLEKRKPPVRRRGRAQVSKFTGICRGC